MFEEKFTVRLNALAGVFVFSRTSQRGTLITSSIRVLMPLRAFLFSLDDAYAAEIADIIAS